MGTHIAVVIDWFGPYKRIQEANEAAKNDYEGGFYLFVGKEKFQKAPPKLLYIGISNNLSYRVNPIHPQLPYISGDTLVWLGEVSSYGIPGKGNKNLIHQAEWAMIYFIQPPLNEKKTAYPPNYPITVFNRWRKQDYETPRKQKPHPAWPDVIDFRVWNFGAKVCWGGSPKWYNSEDFEP